jgi:hypothetical protein
VPKRWCICRGCTACGDHCGRLFDRDLTGTMRCPRCQPAADHARNTRSNTTTRGYGSRHQALRRKLLDQFQPGQPCARCGKPIWTKTDAQLGHDDHDRSRYNGLEHIACNEATTKRKPPGR